MTPLEVVQHLSQLANDLRRLVDELEAAEVQAVNAREDYTLSLSRAFLLAEGAVDKRKHEATVLTHDERLAADLADVRVRGLRRQIDTVRVRIDVGRTVGTTLRAELATLGGQP